MDAAQVERLGQLGPAVALAALHLDDLVDKRPGAAVEITVHGFTLRIEPEARLTLALGRDPQIGDEPSTRHRAALRWLIGRPLTWLPTSRWKSCKPTPAGRQRTDRMPYHHHTHQQPARDLCRDVGAIDRIETPSDHRRPTAAATCSQA